AGHGGLLELEVERCVLAHQQLDVALLGPVAEQAQTDVVGAGRQPHDGVPCGDVTAPRCCPVSRFATVICAAASGAPAAPVTRPCRFTLFCASKPGGAPATSHPAASSTARSR